MRRPAPRAGLRILALCAAASASASAELPETARRGATEDERRALAASADTLRHLDRSRAGVWQWGEWRIVVAEDLHQCWRDVCPFILLSPAGTVPVSDLALGRPRIEDGALVWIRPSGAAARAIPDL